LCEIEHNSDEQLLTINLKLFLTDVNEALVFDPESTELAFCQPNESPKAEKLLLDYLYRFFYVKVNGERIKLNIKSKKLSGKCDNTALGIFFEHPFEDSLESIEVKNIVFTDLFFDQNNVVYVHVNDESKSLMLNKKTPSHKLNY